ncbi:MAG TPA: TrbG/VirB9 family P-type conjugative transfer protein, partial [Thermoanaerobaculia bacterium]|nr:TrbG/VirB9 family P-type conjugative transfer protein [Thermoanaerobaculia bacterium]
MNGRGNVAAKAGWLLGAGRGNVAAKAGWLLGAWMASAALMAAGAEPAAASGAAADTSGAATAADTSGAAAAADTPGTAVADTPGAAAAADMPATAVAADVEREARAAAAGKEPAVLEHGDFVQVPFGRQVPVVRCAPLRVCLIELEEGELVLNTVTGDAARWILDRAAAGPRAATTVIVAKPTACNLTTNLVITTDRRIYQITLDARPCKSKEGENPHEPFTRLLRFYYPDELVRSWASAAAVRRRQGAAAEEAARSLTALGGAAAPAGAGLPLASLHFNYRWTRTGNYPWTPAAVFDD